MNAGDIEAVAAAVPPALARFGEAQRLLHARFDEAGIRHAIHVLDEPLLRPLRALFADTPGEMA